MSSISKKFVSYQSLRLVVIRFCSRQQHCSRVGTCKFVPGEFTPRWSIAVGRSVDAVDVTSPHPLGCPSTLACPLDHDEAPPFFYHWHWLLPPLRMVDCGADSGLSVWRCRPRFPSCRPRIGSEAVASCSEGLVVTVRVSPLARIPSNTRVHSSLVLTYDSLVLTGCDNQSMPNTLSRRRLTRRKLPVDVLPSIGRMTAAGIEI